MGRQGSYNQPQNRRNRRRALAVFLVFISLIMLISDRQQKTMLASGRLTADDISAKVMGWFAFPIHGIEGLLLNWDERSNAYSENKILKAEVERLREYEDKVLNLELRVKRFEEILEIDSSSDVPVNKIVTRVVSEKNGPFVHSALINIGRNKEVKIGHAVMSVDGLYGYVVRVGRSSSRVLLLNDFNSGISVMSVRSQSRAILVGYNETQPKLEYTSLDADWKIGDRVITSGDGGVLPRGLPIGDVVNSNGEELNVDLFTQRQPIDWVWVLPFLPIQTPQEETPQEEISNQTQMGTSNE